MNRRDRAGIEAALLREDRAEREAKALGRDAAQETNDGAERRVPVERYQADPRAARRRPPAATSKVSAIGTSATAMMMAMTQNVLEARRIDTREQQLPADARHQPGHAVDASRCARASARSRRR